MGIFKKDFIYLFLKREGKGGRETSMYERNIYRLPLACSQLGTWPATQACALTGNWTHSLSVCRMMPNTLSYTSQGWKTFDSTFWKRGTFQTITCQLYDPLTSLCLLGYPGKFCIWASVSKVRGNVRQYLIKHLFIKINK